MDLLSQFNAASAAYAVATPSGRKSSERSTTPRINMNSRNNHGTIYFIPIVDKSNMPFIGTNVYRVTSYWGGDNPGQRDNLLLPKDFYGQSEKYDSILNQFNSIYANTDMLTATDWKGSIKIKKTFGIYGWVISHIDATGKQVCDSDGNEHRGLNGAGKLHYIQFSSKGFDLAWDSFMKTQVATQGSPEQWVPRLFSGSGERKTALQINYSLTGTQWTCSISELYFSNQLAGLRNDPVNCPNGYMVPEVSDNKNLVQSLLNIELPENTELINEAHVDNFSRALASINRSFDYYSKYGADAYSTWSQNYGFNESVDSTPQVISAPTPAVGGIVGGPLPNPAPEIGGIQNPIPQFNPLAPGVGTIPASGNPIPPTPTVGIPVPTSVTGGNIPVPNPNVVPTPNWGGPAPQQSQPQVNPELASLIPGITNG